MQWNVQVFLRVVSQRLNKFHSMLHWSYYHLSVENRKKLGWTLHLQCLKTNRGNKEINSSLFCALSIHSKVVYYMASRILNLKSPLPEGWNFCNLYLKTPFEFNNFWISCPVAEIASLFHSSGCAFHCSAEHLNSPDLILSTCRYFS